MKVEYDLLLCDCGRSLRNQSTEEKIPSEYSLLNSSEYLDRSLENDLFSNSLIISCNFSLSFFHLRIKTICWLGFRPRLLRRLNLIANKKENYNQPMVGYDWQDYRIMWQLRVWLQRRQIGRLKHAYFVDINGMDSVSVWTVPSIMEQLKENLWMYRIVMVNADIGIVMMKVSFFRKRIVNNQARYQ